MFVYPQTKKVLHENQNSSNNNMFNFDCLFREIILFT